MQVLVAPALPPNRLRELRNRAGLKIYDVSAMLRRDPATIARYENGETTIPDELKLALAQHYSVSPEYLMGWDRLEKQAA